MASPRTGLPRARSTARSLTATPASRGSAPRRAPRPAETAGTGAGRRPDAARSGSRLRRVGAARGQTVSLPSRPGARRRREERGRMATPPEGSAYEGVVRPPGAPSPLGATWTPEGLNVAVRAPSATLLEACLWIGGEEVRVPLEARSHGVHHGFIRGVDVGTPYGIRAHGPWRPEDGLRFNPAKLLVDPYARAIDGAVRWSDVLRPGTPGDPSVPDPRDSAGLRPARHRRDRRLRLGRRHRPGDVVGGDGPLRDAREGLHRPPPLRPGGDPRDLRRPRPPRGGGAPALARRHRGRAAAGAPLRRRAGARRARRRQLLGLQHAGLLRPARGVRRRPQPRWRRSPSSSGWCAPCTPRASRSSSTWSTTTPARAGRTARRSCSVASASATTTRSRRTAGPTSTPRAAATPSTSATSTSCGSCSTRCGTGSPRCTWTGSGSTSPPR